VLGAGERRVRRALRAILAASLPSAAVACSSGSGDVSSVDAAPSADDASFADSASAPDAAAVSDAFELDVYVDWCEAGAPSLVDADLVGEAGCDYAVRSPCGLPLGWRSDIYGTLDGLTCVRMCPVSTNLLTSCEVYFGQDHYPDGSAPLFDAASAEGGTIEVECSLCGGGGRRPEGYREGARAHAREEVGAYLADVARLEAASVPAFLRLARELGAHHAPRPLVEAAARAARDEVRHARTMAALARRYDAAPSPPDPAPFGVRSLEAMAIENAVEGCVGETYGALVARAQARAARDPAIARAMAGVARDEARHAALAWGVAAWSESRLDAPARRRVRKAQRSALAHLAANLEREPPSSVARLAGVPAALEARTLLGAVRRAVEQRRRVVTRTPPTRNAPAEHVA
jgi:hypothetical protein